MTSHVGRLYAVAVALVVFFLTWAVVAARPWATPSRDPRLAALAARERQVRAESVLVQKIVDARWSAYRRDLARLKARAAQPAVVSAPSVKVVTLPPLTITTSS